MGKRGPKKGEGGRPKINIDFNEFEKLCGLQCTLVEIADWFKTTEDTIEARVKEHYGGKTFSEIYKKHSSKGKMSLRRNQFKLSQKNAAMAIWLGKQYLGQKDKIEQVIEHEFLKPIIKFGDEPEINDIDEINLEDEDENQGSETA